MKGNINRLFGFRSNNPVKKAIAFIYYGLCITFFIMGMSTPSLVEANPYDTGVLRISTFILFLWFISPAIFLSKTLFRNKLPLFKEYRLSASIIGFMLLFVFFHLLFVWVESMHTEEYKLLFNEYITNTFQKFVDAGQNF